MKLVYLPLDERPCNLVYPQMIAELIPDLSLVAPTPHQLGQKKRPANPDALGQWLTQAVMDCQIALISLEMLVYGGLLPSRLHLHPQDTLLERLHRLRSLKQQVPHLRIFASNLIMRTPHYNSSEEEPDYYASYGAAIFRWGWLTDQFEREGLSPKEQEELQGLQASIPPADLADYRDRRSKNRAVNLAAIDLVNEGTLDFLAIPQDDSAPYGFTAQDQQRVVQKISQHRLQRQIHLYPGADEVGCTLLARAYQQLLGQRRKLYPLFSAVGAEQIIPLYEDRPLGESLKSHLLAAGAQWAPSPDTADAVIAINTPGKKMQEAWDQKTQDITYSSYRNLRFFVDQIQQLVNQGIPVAIADVAFANGGDTELVQLLDDHQIWDDLLAYTGWNTTCNTLGTTLALTILGLDSPQAHVIAHQKIYHLLEDWAYQSTVRSDVVHQFLPKVGASYYNFQGQDALIHQAIEQQLLKLWNQTLVHSFHPWTLTRLAVTTPWHRMFEIGMILKIADSSQSHHP
ncbi:DUF4127 family protein [Lyngbya confervoides]|uniref:DUF4127 family protein n=1 Tax=Lyngbya confervoides BDU141951 TaxID=1574623 RepID=A0ABD4T8J8_9CYAN|nr:DUF4127 family protein [Lyngbya confervoides]MCM1985112.1 DUF4127 family protein [Lyngbya confervoides BDU141951]